MPQFVAAVAAFFTVTVTVSGAYAAVATVLAAAWNAAVVGFVLGRIGKALAGRPKGLGGPPPQTFTTKGTLQPRRMVYGEIRTAGHLVWVNTTGSENEILWWVIALAGHEVQSITDVWLGGDKINSADIDSSGLVTAGRFANKVKIYRRTGALSEGVVPEFDSANVAVSGDSIGYGIAKLIIRLERDTEMFPNGSPQEFYALVKGKRVYDPRKDSTNGGSGSHRVDDATTWEWSENPALCAADYFTGGSIVYGQTTPMPQLGMRVPATRINWTYVAAAANTCDETVSIPSSSQKRYVVGCLLSCGDVHEDNLGTILDSMLGNRIWVGGKYRIFAGAYDTPTIALDDDDLTEDGYTYAGLTEDTYNQVTGTYFDPARNWQNLPCAIRRETSYETEDGGAKLRTIDLQGVTNEYRAQRICEIVKKQSRNQLPITFSYKLSALKLYGWATFTHTAREESWTAKVFRARNVKIDLGARRVIVEAMEESAASYADPATGDYAVPGTAAPSSTTERPSAPSNLIATGVQDGIVFTFTPSVYSPPGSVYELYQASSASNFAGATKVAEGTQTPIFLPKADVTERYFWLLNRSFQKQASDRTPSGNGIAGKASSVSPAFTVAASPASLTDEDTTASITTPSTTVTPTNGSSPFTYAWTWDSGGTGITIDSASSATTTFSATGLAVDETRTGQAKCTVTDNGAVVRTTTVSVTIKRLSTALSASVSPATLTKVGTASSLSTASTTVTPSQGTPGYTYAWTWLSGGSGVTINSPTAASTTFSATGLALEETRGGVARCTVTDSASATVTKDVSVTINRTSDL